MVFDKFAKALLLLLVSIYRGFFSLWFGGTCRFEPSCSAYAQEALKKHPTKQAMLLIFKRLGKCHPLGPFGYDPVPDCHLNKEVS